MTIHSSVQIGNVIRNAVVFNVKNWLGFNQLMQQFDMAKPLIVGSPKRARMSVASGWA